MAKPRDYEDFEVIYLKMLSKTAMAAVILGLFATAIHAANDNKAIEERIKPAGELCMAGTECAAAPVAAASSASGSRSGEDIYGRNCAACHSTGAGNAPRLGDAADWSKRAGKGMDTLYNSAINGLTDVGMMPAKGMCMDCSDDELKATVDYMVENSK